MTTRMAVAMLGLAACTGAMGPAGPAGPQGDEGPQGIPGPTGRPAREVHLVVASNGVDLGLYLGGYVAGTPSASCVWNDKAEGELCYGTPKDTLFYDGDDCSGRPYASPSRGRRVSVLYVDRNSDIWKARPALSTVAVRSAFITGGASPGCKAYPGSDLALYPLDLTSVRRDEYDVEDLSLVIR